ncbi:MAG: hypothetical protein K9H41_10100 [Bacteroidia bacterium]|jgi:hypothetical protein|nr:hypothetical protein [Bacteroidia bacterium]
MKTITINSFATGIVATVLLFGSCKKGETGPAGPAGTDGVNGVVSTSTDGFIKGNVIGIRKDGTAFNEPFNYQNYSNGPSGTLDSNNVASYDFTITRGGSDIFGSDFARVIINVTSKTASSGNINLNGFSFTKSLGTNKKFKFAINSSPTTTISGLVYNTSTGLYTGNYSFSIPGFQNSTGNTATISGSFQATITQIYNKVFNPGTPEKISKN